MRLAVVAAFLALAVLPSQAAAAAPLVPRGIQIQFIRLLFVRDDLAYVPTVAPPGYPFQGDQVNQDGLEIDFGPAPKKGELIGQQNIFTFNVQYFKGNLANCVSGNELTLHIGKAKVYTGGNTAWRCLTSVHGKLLKMTVTGVGFSRVALGKIVASGTHVTE